MLVEGSVGSNSPAFCECLRECVVRPGKVGVTGDEVAGGRVNGEGPFRERLSMGECAPATERAAETAVEREVRVGREKFWGLLVAVLGFAGVKLAYIGVGDGAA